MLLISDTQFAQMLRKHGQAYVKSLQKRNTQLNSVLTENTAAQQGVRVPTTERVATRRSKTSIVKIFQYNQKEVVTAKSCGMFHS